METKKAGKDKIKLWTTQSEIVVNTIKENGVYKVKKEYIKEKYGEVSNIFLEAYTWYVNKAKDIVPRPEGAEYPVWLITDPTYLDRSGQGYVIELEVPRRKAIIFGCKKWNKILNLSYIPTDKEDEKNHEEELKRYNLTSDSEAYLRPHYPRLKNKIRNSWDRLFDEEIRFSAVDRASLWQIKKEWIVDIS